MGSILSVIINGTVRVELYTATGNPGEYTFTTGVFNNQSDQTGNGALDIQIGDLMYIPARNQISVDLIPGVFHRWKITSL